MHQLELKIARYRKEDIEMIEVLFAHHVRIGAIRYYVEENNYLNIKLDEDYQFNHQLMTDNANLIQKIEQEEKELQEMERCMNELKKEMQTIRKGKIAYEIGRG